MTCAAGMLCLTDAETGSEGCVVPVGLGTSGVVMSVYFGVLVGIALLSVCIGSGRERARSKKLRAQWKLAEAGKMGSR
jgi:hypothetical protein